MISGADQRSAMAVCANGVRILITAMVSNKACSSVTIGLASYLVMPERLWLKTKKRLACAVPFLVDSRQDGREMI